MRSRLSIFSSRVFGSALIWTALAVIAIEIYSSRALPGKYFSHEVDEIVYGLDHYRFTAKDSVLMGDSVGRQIMNGIVETGENSFVPLASNAAIEMPGQFFLLRRYLKSHPAPTRLILIMGNPVEGNLAHAYAENYVKRVFLHWREIADIAWAKRSAPFTLVTIGYKLFPTLRYRIQLQKTVSFLETANPYFGSLNIADENSGVKNKNYGMLAVLSEWRKKHTRGPTIAEHYFLRFAELLEEKQIRWIYLPLPQPESKPPEPHRERQIERVQALRSQYPHLQTRGVFCVEPDDYFLDGVHLTDKAVPIIAEKYIRELEAVSFGFNAP